MCNRFGGIAGQRAFRYLQGVTPSWDRMFTETMRSNCRPSRSGGTLLGNTLTSRDLAARYTACATPVTSADRSSTLPLPLTALRTCRQCRMSSNTTRSKEAQRQSSGTSSRFPDPTTRTDPRPRLSSTLAEIAPCVRSRCSRQADANARARSPMPDTSRTYPITDRCHGYGFRSSSSRSRNIPVPCTNLVTVRSCTA